MKKLNAILAMCLAASIFVLSVPVSAEDEFVIDGTSLKGYNGAGGDVVIPEGVTWVSAWAFAENESITSVTFPSTVRDIDITAFENCHNIERFEVAEGNEMFSAIDGVLYNANGTSLQRLPNAIVEYTVPAEMKSMIVNVFGYCKNLETINVHPDNEKYASIDGVLYSKDLTRIQIVPALKTECNIPKEVIYKIGQGQYDEFYCAGNLRSINVDPDNPKFTSVDGVMYTKDMTELVRVPNGVAEYTFPESVKKVWPGAFEGNNYIKELVIPKTYQSTESSYMAFSFMNALESISIQYAGTIGGNMFRFCRSLKNVTIGEEITGIGSDTFGGCTQLKEIAIPDSVTSIGVSPFGEDVTIICSPNSYAAQYAEENGYTWRTPDGYVEAAVPGDASGDGKVSLSDVSLILQSLAGWENITVTDHADVNDDGKTSLSDVSLILQYIAHWDVVLK